MSEGSLELVCIESRASREARVERLDAHTLAAFAAHCKAFGHIFILSFTSHIYKRGLGWLSLCMCSLPFCSTALPVQCSHPVMLITPAA